MKFSLIKRFCYAPLVLLLLSLTGCGGGTTAGIGGSGIGGTGITANVNGNIVQVTASLAPTANSRTVALLFELAGPVASAQTIGIAGIKVSGGGQQTVTDMNGRFMLPNVVPNNNFVLNLSLPSGQNFTLAVGKVPAGTIVEVKDIVISTSQPNAESGKIEVKDDPTKDDDKSGSNEPAGDSESNENKESAKFVHDPSLTNCAECHAADFRQDKHLKVEEPKIYYTLAELSNCSGTCHLYRDDTFSMIKESWSNKHSISQDDW